MNKESKNRIAYFSDAPYSGGAEKYLHLLASGIDRDRFTPLAIICNPTQENRLHDWMNGSGIETFTVEWRSPMSPSGLRSMYRLMKRISADILHMNLPGPFDSRFSIAAPVAKWAGITGVVSTEHLPMFPSFPKARLLKGFATRYVDTVITVSEDNRSYLVKEHKVPGKKIETIYNGIPGRQDLDVEVPFQRSGSDGSMLRLLIAGSIEERKGHAVLIDVLKSLPSQVVLTVAGEGPARETIEKSIADAGLGQRVSIVGFKDDLIPLMRGADLLVVPSFIEATPYVILEAFSAGLPVVASNIYGIPELVREGVTGSLASAGDVSGFVSAIMRYYSDRALLKATSVRCMKEFRDRFTLERSVMATCRVYDEILSAGTKRGGSG